MNEQTLFLLVFIPAIAIIFGLAQYKWYNILTGGAMAGNYKNDMLPYYLGSSIAIVVAFLTNGETNLLWLQLPLFIGMSFQGGSMSAILYGYNNRKGSGYDKALKIWNAAHYLLTAFLVVMACAVQYETMSAISGGLFILSAVCLRWVVYDGKRNLSLHRPFFEVGTVAFPDRFLMLLPTYLVAIIKVGLFVLSVVGFLLAIH